MNNEVFEKIQHISFNLAIGDQTNSSDIGYYNLLKQGETEKDLHKIYEFIKAYEQGCFWGSPQELVKFVNDAYILDADQLLRILNQKERIIDIFLFVDCCKNEMIFHFIESKSITNPYLLFECIRKLFIRNKIRKIPNSELSTFENNLTQAIIQLSTLNLEIWKFFISYFEHETNFFKILGAVLQGLSKDALLIYAGTIDIQHSESDLSKITEAFQSIAKDKSDTVIEVIADTFYLRWQQHIKTIKGKGEFKNKLLLNAYTNVILYSMCYLFRAEKLFVSEMEHILSVLLADQFRWYSSTEVYPYFFSNITQLYLITLVGVNLGFNIKTRICLEKMMHAAKSIIITYDYLWDKNCIRQYEDIINNINNICAEKREYGGWKNYAGESITLSETMMKMTPPATSSTEQS